MRGSRHGPLQTAPWRWWPETASSRPVQHAERAPRIVPGAGRPTAGSGIPLTRRNRRVRALASHTADAPSAAHSAALRIVVSSAFEHRPHELHADVLLRRIDDPRGQQAAASVRTVYTTAVPPSAAGASLHRPTLVRTRT